MKKSGQCPKCNSTEVYTNEKAKGHGHRSILMVSIFSSAQINAYICLNCGFMEEYLAPQTMSNPSKMEKIRSKWSKNYPQH